MNTLTSNEPIVKLRPNLFQLPTGHVVGYGAILAPGGLYFCFTCGSADCGHTVTVDEAWVNGEHSAEDISFDEMIFASSADLAAMPPETFVWPDDDYGLNEPTL